MKSDGPPTESAVDATLDAVMPRQRQLWMQGEPVQVETLLEQFPALRRDREKVLDLINHEIVLRGEFGQPPTQDEYLQRFPEFRSDLVLLFQVHAAIEGPSHDSPTNVAAEQTLIRPSPPPAPSHAPPERFGGFSNFTFHEVLGQGGMGVVYRATDHRLKRAVALKMILAGGGHDDRQRFQNEAEAVAKLDHPHIVHIFEVGEIQGQPYCALEYLDGGSLAKLLQGEPQPAALAAQMVETLARAVHYAHSQGIIHRDLKPANILLQKVKVAEGATVPPGLVVKGGTAYLPKVADFGLAKNVEPNSQASQTQAIVGTPSYMAPEQAGDFARKIGAPADVYALGAILYEMIAGRPPFRGADVLETLQQVRTMDPVPPRRLQPHCPRDLDTICLKCLKKDPAARYPSAADLADDLGRFLRREPIHARPTGTAEQVVLWCRRNPGIARLTASLAVVFLISFVTVFWLWRRAVEGETKAYTHLYASQINLGQRYWREMQYQSLGELLQKLAHPPPGQRDLRDFEWYYLSGLLAQELAQFPGKTCVAYSPDGNLLATAGPGYQLQLWPAELPVPGQPLLQWQAHAKGITSVAFGPRGEYLLSGSTDRTARLWRVRDGTEAKVLTGHDAEVNSVAVDPVQGVLATADRDGSIRVWEPDGSARLILGEENVGPVNQIAFSPDGKLLASAGNDFKVRIWDVLTGEVLHTLQGHTDVVLTVAFSPDGKVVASGGWDGTLRLWDIATAKVVRAFPQMPRWIQRVAFRPDGKRLAAACWDQTIHVWDLAQASKNTTARQEIVLRGHLERVTDISFHPSANRLAAVDMDNAVRIWNPDWDPEIEVIDLESLASCFALNPGEPLLAAVATYPGPVRLCDLGGLPTVKTLPAPAERPLSVAFSTDGRLLATGGQEGSIRLWQMPAGKLVRHWAAHPGAVRALAFDAFQQLVSAGKDGTVRFWDTASGKETGRAGAHDGPVYGLAISSDGRWLASAGEDKTLRVWDLIRQVPERTLPDVGIQVNSLAFSPDSTKVAVVGNDSAMTIWDWRRGTPLQKLRIAYHAGHTSHVAFSHSGTRLVSVGADGNLKLWDLATGQELLTLKGPGREVVGVAFSADDRKLVAAGNSAIGGQIRVWDSRPDPASRERKRPE
jgi:WD40 repeat protein/serine/threonine protein kinase